MPEGSPFDRLRVRWLVAQFVLVIGAALWSYNRLIGSTAQRAPGGDERVVAMLAYCAIVLVLLVRGHFARVSWRGLFGRWPTRDQLPLLFVVVPVDLLTLGATVAVFVPLSYVAPRFVERFVLSSSALFDARSLGQWLGLVVIAAIVAPVVEELFFRGILLHRWARRWGTVPAVVASSLFFATLHAEWVGHFLFGVAMSALYLRTRTLWLPILAHALSNFIIALTTLPEALEHAPAAPDTLASLRGDLPLGLAALVAGVLALLWYLREWWSDGRLRATLAGPLPYEVYASSGTGSPDSTSAA